MLHLCEKLSQRPASRDGELDLASITLSFEDRRKSRLRACLDDGREVAVLLPRGTILHEGDHLLDKEEKVLVVVKATAEALSVARATDHLILLRAAYHLGNRHVPVQIGPDWLAYEHDHVLDTMVRQLALTVTVEHRSFDPEAGGYGHGHGHGESHLRGHAHEPGDAP
ncbi:MAG TPA: urease accessory protein UreE [Polyangia bacterium]